MTNPGARLDAKEGLAFASEGGGGGGGGVGWLGRGGVGGGGEAAELRGA